MGEPNCLSHPSKHLWTLLPRYHQVRKKRKPENRLENKSLDQRAPQGALTSCGLSTAPGAQAAAALPAAPSAGMADGPRAGGATGEASGRTGEGEGVSSNGQPNERWKVCPHMICPTEVKKGPFLCKKGCSPLLSFQSVERVEEGVCPSNC